MLCFHIIQTKDPNVLQYQEVPCQLLNLVHKRQYIRLKYGNQQLCDVMYIMYILYGPLAAISVPVYLKTQRGSSTTLLSLDHTQTMNPAFITEHGMEPWV